MKRIKWGNDWNEFNLFQKVFGRNGLGLLILIIIIIVIISIT